MLVRAAYLAVSLAVLSLLGGCGFLFRFEQREAWRDEVEAACLASGEVFATTDIQPMRPISGPRICGLKEPFKVSALASGEVSVSPAATIGCPMVASLEHWLRTSVQNAALAQFGVGVSALKPLSSYSCRPVDNIPGEQLSEHAFGNAIDIGFFRLADGREISVEKGWKGSAAEKAFLRTVFAGACAEFFTVLGPGSDSYHYNHFHLDLRASNGRNGKHYCRPQIEAPPPARGFGLPMAQSEPAISLLDRTALTGAISRPHP